ncbi:YqgQ family protein [Lactobacillus corticis]|uniref:DUF910 family protein n=1 Tax=Lactobacillus corticis TaxID=2201249 RepID=A0A916VJ00_9LACO|nr:YqgQ family protein [Lactobacillus corticis]GFZ26699.1 hypothetical protein LCB40_05790 [Lactobacillus corticis]
MKLRTLYDVQQLLEKYGILVHLGKRIWDIDMMEIELDNIYKAGVMDQHDYLRAKLVLRHEHDLEEKSDGKI